MILWDFTPETGVPVMLSKVLVTSGNHLISQFPECRRSPLYVNTWGCVCVFLGTPLFSVHPHRCVLLDPSVLWAWWNWGSSPAKAEAAHGF